MEGGVDESRVDKGEIMLEDRDVIGKGAESRERKEEKQQTRKRK